MQTSEEIASAAHAQTSDHLSLRVDNVSDSEILPAASRDTEVRPLDRRAFICLLIQHFSRYVKTQHFENNHSVPETSLITARGVFEQQNSLYTYS